MSDVLRDALGNALAQAIHDCAAEMVIKWVAVVEAIDVDGERGVWLLSDDQCKPWDSQGLLTHALIEEKAAATARAIYNGAE